MHPHRARSALFVVAVSLLGCRPSGLTPVSSPTPDTASIGRDIRYLASDALEGRATGTAGNDSAAAYIARRFGSLRLTPLVVDSATCSARANTKARCTAAFVQPFTARSVAAAHAGVKSELATRNVVALVRGVDPTLRGQYVVIGAHFDHLGRSSFGALDPEKPNEIHNGADDNASGTAAVMDLARLLRQRPPKRSIVVVTFSGEELGLLGSQYFVDHPPIPLDSVQAMVNFDMVGRLRDDKLIVYGVATATELSGIVAAANVAPAFKINGVGDGFGPSDQSSFYGKNLPVLHFFTDVHDDYHKATDDPDKINIAGEGRVVAFAEGVIRTIADRPGRLTFVRAAAPATSSRTTSQAYLGSIPDMGASETSGLKLSGVRAGSPADSAGLRVGDVIVEISGAPVKDLYSYSDALYAHQPGERITIVALRDGKRMTFQVTLGRRSS
jgi:peptidase M28-like protein/PDZ domain-containing protein